MRLINKEGNGKVHKGKAMLIFLDMLDTPEEKNCFQIIYETYSHFLWYLADQILHDAHLAEDAVQGNLSGTGEPHGSGKRSQKQRNEEFSWYDREK